MSQAETDALDGATRSGGLRYEKAEQSVTPVGTTAHAR